MDNVLGLLPVNTNQLLEMVGDIYEAATEATRWARVLQKIADCTRSTLVGLPYLENLGSPTFGVIAAVNLDENFAKGYAKFAHLDPYRGRLFSRDVVTTGEMLMPERDFLRTEYYNDFLRRFDVCYHLGGPVLMHQTAGTVFVVNRPHRIGPFGEREIEFVGLLMPHFKRALQLHQRLAALQTQNRGLLEGLDALPAGLLLVNSQGKIIVMNRSAERILAERDGLSSAARSLCAECFSENQKLQRILHAAATTAARQGTVAGGAMLVSRPSLRRSYSLLVSPVRWTGDWIPGVQSPAAMVFLSDPEASTQPDERLLRALFGLTSAECRLTNALLQGKTLQAAADLLGVTRNTAHSQLQGIFGKTGTTRQAELMRVLGATLVTAKFSTEKGRAA